MAKLRDLQDILPEIADVTPARANVWIMVARKAGLFTTGGRGVNAPEIGPRDVTNGLLLALQLAAPTEAAEAVTALRNLPLKSLRLSGRKVPASKLTNETLARANTPLLAGLDEKDTLGAVLDRYFASLAGPKTLHVEHAKTSDRLQVVIEFPQNGLYFGSPINLLDFRETITMKGLRSRAIPCLRALLAATEEAEHAGT